MTVAFITITDTGTRRLLVKGRARDLLRRHQVPAVWSNIDRGWWLDRDRLPDLLAQAQEGGVRVKQVVK